MNNFLWRQKGAEEMKKGDTEGVADFIVANVSVWLF